MKAAPGAGCLLEVIVVGAHTRARTPTHAHACVCTHVCTRAHVHPHTCACTSPALSAVPTPRSHTGAHLGPQQGQSLPPPPPRAGLWAPDSLAAVGDLCPLSQQVGQGREQDEAVPRVPAQLHLLHLVTNQPQPEGLSARPTGWGSVEQRAAPLWTRARGETWEAATPPADMMGRRPDRKPGSTWCLDRGPG